MNLHVSWADPPQKVNAARAKRLWCFTCRKRTLHELWAVSGAYYDPEFYRKCRVCGQSDTRFPGQ